MALSLSKGGNLSLTKSDPGMKKALIGLGWDARSTDGQPFDLDASAFMIGANDKVRSENDLIYYNKLSSSCGSIIHTGDNRTGAGDGDDEAIKIDLSKVSSDVSRIVIVVTIHMAAERRQSFGQVRNAFIRVANEESGVEIARHDLTEDRATETAMIFGEVYRHAGEWKFKAVAQGYNGGLQAMCANFGIVAN